MRTDLAGQSGLSRHSRTQAGAPRVVLAVIAGVTALACSAISPALQDPDKPGAVPAGASSRPVAQPAAPRPQPGAAPQPFAPRRISGSDSRVHTATQPASGPSEAPPTQPITGPAPRIELTPLDLKFGTVWQGEAVEREFTVKNAGDASLEVRDLRPSCGCTTVSKPKSPLAPGETTTFKIAFDSRLHPGPALKNVTVLSNDPRQSVLVITIQGQVNPLLKTSPQDRIAIQDIEPNAVVSDTMKLENLYSAPLQLRLKPGETHGRFDVALREIEPGQVYELTATTKPPLLMAPNVVTITLETGLAIAPELQCTAMAYVQPRIIAVPSQLYTPRPGSTPGPQVVRVQYRPGQPMKITAVKPSFDGITCEIVPPTTTQPLPNETRLTYELRFTVPAQVPADTHIEILTDDPAYPRLDLPVIRVP